MNARAHRGEKRTVVSGTRITGGCEASGECWKPNLGLLQKQRTPLTSRISPDPELTVLRGSKAINIYIKFVHKEIWMYRNIGSGCFAFLGRGRGHKSINELRKCTFVGG